ncbi:MAG: acetylornithine transaminase [Peptococcaceae bacterium]|nr:acetylornithine transaminase [Peptococcaceae bacterium]
MKSSEIIDTGNKYVMNTYGRLSLALVRGSGARVWDAEGREYLDFVSGLAVNSLGHCHPAVVKAIVAQAETLIHVSNMYHIEPQVRLAALLVENTCADRVFFCNSGAEANEGAIKLARKYGKSKGNLEKFEIITAINSFHGRTLATITATGQPKYQKGFEPLPAGFSYVNINNIEEIRERAGSNTCAIILEPIQGEGGVNELNPEYIKAIKDICKEHDILLIFDEVQCGLGRTGKFMGYQHYGIEPDIFTLAKALGGGFPIGAMLAKEDIASSFSPGDHASTFGGNPLASAAALAAVEEILNGGLVDNSSKVGEYFKKQLIEMKESSDIIIDVRGKGLMLGMEFSVECRKLLPACQEKGLLINCVGDKTLRFLPPLIITEADVDKALDIVREAIRENL